MKSLLLLAPLAAAVENKFPSYAPTTAPCPSTPLVRPAAGLNANERDYVERRKAVAGKALRTWLGSTAEKFELTSTPSIALAISGGGYRSMLLGAGVVQALDGRDGNSSVAGLYQALTYQGGLSGGSWLLASIAANGNARISDVAKKIWEVTPGLVKNSIFPLNFPGSTPEAPHIKQDMLDCPVALPASRM